ncbi:hypothetical protein NicSoilB8_29430 [Arthrobacter sp. NicSoilB8]|nr:hypothetical protein NicSoilB8_29430 [Arthrobacter sp. NicSoilB8]
MPRDLKAASTVRASTVLTGSTGGAVHPDRTKLIAATIAATTTATDAAAALLRLVNRSPVTLRRYFVGCSRGRPGPCRCAAPSRPCPARSVLPALSCRTGAGTRLRRLERASPKGLGGGRGRVGEGQPRHQDKRDGCGQTGHSAGWSTQ